MHPIEAVRPERQALEQMLLHHYMLDPTAANELANGVTSDGETQINMQVVEVEKHPEAVAKRDANREEIIRISQGKSDKQLIVVGPCSLDKETNFTTLLDYIEELQDEHPDAVIAFRANGAKPRTAAGNTGTFNSIDPEDLDFQLCVYGEAFRRGIPILTEITDKDEFAVLAPYLSAVWLGARDMKSTSLRRAMSATRMAVFVKNSDDGTAESVENAIKMIGSSTADNKGSGVNLGLLGYGYLKHWRPAMVTVGEGNKNVGIIARGYKLPEGAGPRQSRWAVFKHIGELCTLAAQLDTIVLIDGSHDVPPMLAIDKKVEDRFPKVIDIIFEASMSGRIPHFERVAGLVGEIGTWRGHTDHNLIINTKNRQRITKHINRLKLFQAELMGSISEQ